jgi:hypothetical protein
MVSLTTHNGTHDMKVYYNLFIVYYLTFMKKLLLK